MRKILIVVFAALVLLMAGCSGQNEGAKPAATPTPVSTPEAERTPEPAQGGSSGGSGASAGGINTLYDLFVAKKMYYGKATVVENGETRTVEFWYYYDADNNEQMIRMEHSEGGVVIMRNKYEDNTLTMTMYMKGMQNMPVSPNCDWVMVKTTQTVSPGEAEELKDEPVGDAFTATVSYQGQVMENYEGKFVDADLTLFQPDGNVCSVTMMMTPPQG
ncbi:hypothetical protein [Geoglobus acetivorans]|uniref:Uncharacterized protein n=1 Tax=Geoglobus acetivorans TaxID=565033 RepID=A0A0A7GEV0_GEOAI|nr:hypothetical protein GACE_1292 [Geoglobus acetivorans]